MPEIKAPRPYKRGETIRILIDTISEIEWDNIYPWDSVKCEAEFPRLPSGEQEYIFDVTADEVNRTLMLTAVTNDNWDVNAYKMDIRITKDGEHKYYPSGDSFITFSIVRPVTDDEIGG